MPFKLSLRDKVRAKGVSPILMRVVRKAALIAPPGFKFFVIRTGGVRTLEQQRQKLLQGVSTTMHSLHLIGHAIDLAVTINGQLTWDWGAYERLYAECMAPASKFENVPIEWGGHWRTIHDGLHFQLDETVYLCDWESVGLEPKK